MAEYDTIEVSPGETREIRVSGEGEVFENKLIDISADGAVCRVIVDGHNNAVRNVGWKGVQDERSYAVLAHVGTGDALFENIYMGDGVHPDIDHSAGDQTPTAMWASPDSQGSLTVRGANIQDWADNGMYLSSATNTLMTVENSYVARTANSNIRVGTDGSVIRNCVIREPVHRGVWVWGPATATVENCHIYAPDAPAFWAGEGSNGGATINVRDTEYTGEVAEPHGVVNFEGGNGSNPQDFLPEGCPSTAEEAASGEPSDGYDPLENTLTIEGAGVETEYRIEVSGEIRGQSDTIEGDEVFGESWVEGLVMEHWVDEFRFSGEVTNVEYLSGGPFNMYVNGSQVDDPLQYPESDTGGGGGGGRDRKQAMAAGAAIIAGAAISAYDK